MGLEKVISQIEAKSKKEAEKVISDSEEEIKKIVESAKKTAEELRRSKEKECEEYIEGLRRREISIAELDAKKIILNMKEEILANAYKGCIEKLKYLPADKNELYLKKLLEKGKVFKNAIVYCAGKDVEFIVKNCDYKLIPTEILGGIIIEKEDKTVKLDFSYETLAEMVWNKHLKDFANILFGE